MKDSKMDKSLIFPLAVSGSTSGLLNTYAALDPITSATIAMVLTIVAEKCIVPLGKYLIDKLINVFTKKKEDKPEVKTEEKEGEK